MGTSNRNKTLCGRKRNKTTKESSNIFILNMNGEAEEVIIKYRSQPQHKPNMKWAELSAPFRVDDNEVCLRSFAGVYDDKSHLLSSN